MYRARVTYVMGRGNVDASGRGRTEQAAIRNALKAAGFKIGKRDWLNIRRFPGGSTCHVVAYEPLPEGDNTAITPLCVVQVDNE